MKKIGNAVGALGMDQKRIWPLSLSFFADLRIFKHGSGRLLIHWT